LRWPPILPGIIGAAGAVLSTMVGERPTAGTETAFVGLRPETARFVMPRSF